MNEKENLDHGDSSREKYDDFIERYVYTFSNNYIPVTQCASFIVQRKNRDLQQAITYLTRYSSYKRLCKRYQLHTRLDIVVQAISSVRETIANDMTDDDIEQIAELAFVQAKTKYQPDRGIPFKNFLYHYYKWLFVNELKRNLWHTPIADNSVHYLFNGEINQDQENGGSTESISKNLDDISFSQEEFLSTNVLTAVKIDHDWIEGGSCSWLFKDLTPMERMIIKKVFIDEISIRKVAQELGYYPTMIKNIIEEAKSKIESNIREDEQDYEDSCI